MSDPSTRRLNNLLLATSARAMALASSSLYLANPALEKTPQLAGESFKEMRYNFDSLEAGTCALLHYAGVSWGVLAVYYDVSRQSLHNRIASRADQRMEEAQGYLELSRDDFNNWLEMANGIIGRLETSFDEDLSYAAEIWQARRKQPGWWRVEYHSRDR